MEWLLSGRPFQNGTMWRLIGHGVYAQEPHQGWLLFELREPAIPHMSMTVQVLVSEVRINFEAVD